MAQEMTPEELKMYEKCFALIGARVNISCDRTVYQGIIESIINELKMVTLRHTTLNGDYIGVTRFRFREIVSLSVVESAKVVNRYPRNDYLLDILKNKAGKKYNINDLLFDGQLSDVSDDDEKSSDDEDTEEFVLELPPQLKNKLPNDSTVIDSLDSNFTQAIQDIFKQEVIGVSFDGPQISRFGRLTSVCVSTESHVYLFDIETLKIEAFENGLRDILEDKSIKKVIHDCRFPSDCLAHRYGTQLANVFDTQVADFIINLQRYNDKYEYNFVSTLDCCVRNHLDVPPEFLYKHVKSSDKKKIDYRTKRPICNDFRHDLIKDALYLVLLQKTLASKLLDPLHKNVGVYLRVIANASQEEIDTLGYELSPPDKLPPAILMYGIQTVRFQKPQKKVVSFKCKFIDPKTGYVVGRQKIQPSENVASNSKSAENKVREELTKKSSIPQMNSKYQEDHSSSSPVEDRTSTSNADCNMIDTITARPSLRHLDELYHKCVNNLRLQSQNAGYLVNVKPSEHYTSKFTFRKPFDTNSTSEHSNATETASSSTQSDSSNFNWASLCDGLNTSSLPQKGRNIRFVPA